MLTRAAAAVSRWRSQYGADVLLVAGVASIGVSIALSVGAAAAWCYAGAVAIVGALLLARR